MLSVQKEKIAFGNEQNTFWMMEKEYSDLINARPILISLQVSNDQKSKTKNIPVFWLKEMHNVYCNFFLGLLKFLGDIGL